MTYPASGNLVIAAIRTAVSGNSSVPWWIPAGDALGTLMQIDDSTWIITDDYGRTLRLYGVYDTTTDDYRQPSLWLTGWQDGVHTRWIVTA